MLETRRLAAIMFTDIVGYTALMGKDQDKALKLLRKNREIQQQLIKNHRGEWLKEMGDGILAQFGSATDSVQCAIEIQKQAREELEGQIRIGIHLGDVTFENEDVFGDGVNIASRLQSISDPGGIYISESLQKAIRGKSDIQTKYLGEFDLKNVDYYVKTYSVQGEGLPVPTTAKIKELAGKGLKERIFGSVYTYIVLLILVLASGWWIRSVFFIDKSTITSLAILPFDNYTGSDELEYFVAGMHSSLIWDVGKISALQVTSKTSSRAYKDVEKSIPEIASELGVDAVIEASVLCLGDSVCIQVRLVSAFPEEKQLWVQDYYEEKSQILNLYNRVTKEISKEINVILTPQEESLLAVSRTVNNEAYDAYLKGQFYLDQVNADALQKATEFFNIAIEKDPDWAPPYAGLAEVGSYQMQMGFVSPSITIPKIQKNLNIALKLDPNSANSHYVKAVIAVWTEWDWEKGEKEFLIALELNPSNALCRIFYGHLLMILCRSEEALIQGKIAVELDPLRPFVLALNGTILTDAGDYQSAIAHAEKALSIEPDHYFANLSLEEASYLNGDYAKSFYAFKQITLLGDEVMSAIEKTFERKGYFAALEEWANAQEEAATEGYLLPLAIAESNIRLKKYNKTLEWLEKGYEFKDPNMPYISTKISSFDQLKDNPKFIELLKKMDLPLQ